MEGLFLCGQRDPLVQGPMTPLSSWQPYSREHPKGPAGISPWETPPWMQVASVNVAHWVSEREGRETVHLLHDTGDLLETKGLNGKHSWFIFSWKGLLERFNWLSNISLLIHSRSWIVEVSVSQERHTDIWISSQQGTAVWQMPWPQTLVPSLPEICGPWLLMPQPFSKLSLSLGNVHLSFGEDEMC